MKTVHHQALHCLPFCFEFGLRLQIWINGSDQIQKNGRVHFRNSGVKGLTIFSSPEHKCSGWTVVIALSGVRRLWCVLGHPQFASNDISAVNTGLVSTKVDRIVPWEVPYENCSNCSTPLYKMAVRAKNNQINFRQYLHCNHWGDFNQTW